MSDKASFLNRVRSLFNIDGWLLPELTKEQQLEFVRDPVRYFMATDKPQGDAIWREISKRQDAPARRAWTQQEIVDLLSDAIGESLGPDWNSTDGANYCFDALTQADIIGPATLATGGGKP